MTWKLYKDSLIFSNNKEKIEGKTSSKIIHFNKSINFSLDEISNVTYKIELIKCSNDFFEEDLDIFTFKILVKFRLEYGKDDFKRVVNLEGLTGDFLISRDENQRFILCPLILCLWKNENRELVLSINYEISEIK